MENRENRDTFFARLRPRLTPSDIRKVELAYLMAKYGHRAQKRKELDEQGEPVRYFEHVRRVALVLMDELGIFDVDMIVTCLMHDCFEDTKEITPELTEHFLGEDTTRMILTLSKTPKEGYRERFLKSTNWRVYVIKGCDRLDNLRSLSSTSEAHQEKQLRETEEDYFPLFDRMVELTPKEYSQTAQALRDTIRMVTYSSRRMLKIQNQA